MSENVVKKDVIYLDVEDDITDIVNKIKKSKERIIAIVPPKNLGSLRSAVNLRLLARSAEKADKKIVIVSNNKALRPMCAIAKIPITQSLHSKPEVPEIDAIKVDDDEIIDGGKLPIADFSGGTLEDKENEILNNLDIDESIDDNKDFKPKAAKSAKTPKIPDFKKFRKKAFIIGGLSIAVIVFLVWATVFAPSAKVIISAKTNSISLKEKVKLVNSDTLEDAQKGVLATKTESLEQNNEVTVDATGKKDIGEASKGNITLSQSSESEAVTVLKGTAFSAGGCNFVTTSNATIPGVKVRSGNLIAGSTTVGIQATEIGEKCNLSPQTYISAVEGVSAKGEALSGGTKKTISVVSQNDINNAKQQLAKKSDNNIESQLLSKIDNNFIAIKDSYKATAENPVASPSVNEEASNGKVTVKSKVVHNILAIKRDSLATFIENQAKQKIGKVENQKIYDNGVKKIALTNYSDKEITASTEVKVGPEIKESELRSKIADKKTGEVQSILEKIEGVNKVEVKFSYFWVNKIPKDNDKLSIEFTVE